jgi:hypothetical protein
MSVGFNFFGVLWSKILQLLGAKQRERFHQDINQVKR